MLKWVNKSLGRPETAEELETKCKEMSKADSAQAIRLWTRLSEKYVQNEVNLALLRNEVRLKYIPIPSSRESKWEMKERARYEILVKIQDKDSRDYGKTFLYHPCNDWVEENFTNQSLALVQSVAEETNQMYNLKGLSKKEQGYVSLENSKPYMDKGIERQISKMRFVPGKEVLDLWGKTVWRAESWHGLVVGNNVDVAEQVLLDSKWVETNITKAMRTFLREVREKEGHKGFVLIPEGDNEKHAASSIMFLDNAPPLKYFNNGSEIASRKCVLDSTASALHFLGLDRLAWALKSKSNGKESQKNPMGFVGDLLMNHMNKKERKMFECFALNNNKLKTWDTLNSPKEFLLCLCGVQSSDGKTDHAICIAGGWIFDSNFEKAIPLSIESLNLCSSSDDRPTTFVKVTRGYLLRVRK
jgi:hypothetical protein